MDQPIGFKEWQVVCDALASGRQTILLRKGGIHEGRNGFSFAHDSFFLFPTRFHAQSDQIREGKVTVMPEWQPGDEIVITHHAAAEWAITLTDRSQVDSLKALHIYSDSTVSDRYDWEGKGMSSGSIHVALIRIRELATPWVFPYEKSYGGCRSWITLPDAPQDALTRATPVISDQDFAAIKAQLATLLP